MKKGEKAVLKDVVSEDGQGFFADRPGTYLSTYLITPEKGDSYEVTRKIVVKPREAESKGADHGQKGNKEDTEESDPEPEPVLTEAPEVPENTEHLKLDVSPDNAAFLSVVPESMAKNRSINANLVVGERLPYPSSLGNYSTTYFTVNGHVAYCLESAKTSPPSSDYVANIFESNLALQKVLYYGYGGPGDITDSYMPGFDWKLKYIFTHIAASYGETPQILCSRAYQQGDDSSLLYEQTKAYAKGRSAEQILIVPQNAEEGDGTDTLLKRVQTYIRNHYTERLTLADIAEAVHVSSSYLSRFYKLKAGENLFDTINSLRVEKAKELLLRGDKKIYEIAALTGFEDTAYFSKVFKKYAGCPPKEYEQSGGRNL